MKQILSIGLLAWSTAHAVELGSVSLTSVEGEPLRAQIPIKLAAGESMQQLAASIIETNPHLPDLHLVLAEAPAPHINLSSKKPITLKKLGLTLQVSQGDEENEYHYDLTFKAMGLNTAQQTKPFSYGPVKPGETLWQVATVFAKQYKITPEQAMASLHEHNKNAFAQGNKNQLMAGSYLSLPQQLKKSKPVTHPPVLFTPTDIVKQTHVVEPAPAIAVADTASSPTVIPEFPSIEQGKQIAMNVSSGFPGVPSLKLLSPLSDARSALFTQTLNHVIGDENTAMTKLLDTLRQDLKGAHEAIALEREAKERLQTQLDDLQIQMRALAELVSLQQTPGRIALSETTVQAGSLPMLFQGIGSSPLAMVLFAIAAASLLMYAWDRFAPTRLTPVPVASVTMTKPKPRPTLPSLHDVDACVAQGRYYQAQELLESMLKHRPSDFDALYKLCQLYVKTDSRSSFESKVGKISPRWRMMYPERFDRLKALHQRAWAVSMSVHGDEAPVYEGDPPSDPVQTKLDLARAYIDIGDQASAYDILEEVLREGTAAQVASAQVLMGQIKS